MTLDDPSADAFAVLTAQAIINRHAAGMCDRCRRWKPLLLRRQLMRVCVECSSWVPLDEPGRPHTPVD